MDLSLHALRRANLARLPLFKDAKGRLSHPVIEGRPVGHDWNLSQWANATCGELGEAANLIKKIERGDFDLEDPGVREKLGDELCDVLTYLDLLAYRAGIDLAEATRRKWDAVSERVGAEVRIADFETP
jgi:NTP pyrophosphatase (non-canonical NTP hydrolase)